jgi:hypothetical protein
MQIKALVRILSEKNRTGNEEDHLKRFVVQNLHMSNSVLFEISSSHGGEYDVQDCLLGCTAV